MRRFLITFLLALFVSISVKGQEDILLWDFSDGKVPSNITSSVDPGENELLFEVMDNTITQGHSTVSDCTGGKMLTVSAPAEGIKHLSLNIQMDRDDIDFHDYMIQLDVIAEEENLQVNCEFGKDKWINQKPILTNKSEWNRVSFFYNFPVGTTNPFFKLYFGTDKKVYIKNIKLTSVSKSSSKPYDFEGSNPALIYEKWDSKPQAGVVVDNPYKVGNTSDKVYKISSSKQFDLPHSNPSTGGDYSLKEYVLSIDVFAFEECLFDVYFSSLNKRVWYNIKPGRWNNIIIDLRNHYKTNNKDWGCCDCASSPSGKTFYIDNYKLTKIPETIDLYDENVSYFDDFARTNIDKNLLQKGGNVQINTIKSIGGSQFASILNSGLYKLAPNASKWENISSKISSNGIHIKDFAVNPNNENDIYIVYYTEMSSNIAVSHNGGKTYKIIQASGDLGADWESKGITFNQLTCFRKYIFNIGSPAKTDDANVPIFNQWIAVDPNNPNNIYISGYSDDNFLVKSSDAGKTFEGIKDRKASQDKATGVFVDRNSRLWVYQEKDSKVYFSTDNGNSFKYVTLPSGFPIKIKDDNKGNVYICATTNTNDKSGFQNIYLVEKNSTTVKDYLSTVKVDGAAITGNFGDIAFSPSDENQIIIAGYNNVNNANYQMETTPSIASDVVYYKENDEADWIKTTLSHYYNGQSHLEKTPVSKIMSVVFDAQDYSKVYFASNNSVFSSDYIYCESPVVYYNGFGIEGGNVEKMGASDGKFNVKIDGIEYQYSDFNSLPEIKSGLTYDDELKGYYCKNVSDVLEYKTIDNVLGLYLNNNLLDWFDNPFGGLGENPLICANPFGQGFLVSTANQGLLAVGFSPSVEYKITSPSGCSTTKWIGENSDWENPSNWTALVGVPTESTIAIISSKTNSWPVINSALKNNPGKIKLSKQAELLLNNNSVLKVTNELSLEGKSKITVESGSGITAKTVVVGKDASLILNCDDANTSNGTLIVEEKISGNVTLNRKFKEGAWTRVGSPFANTHTNLFTWSRGYYNPNFMKYHEEINVTTDKDFSKQNNVHDALSLAWLPYNTDHKNYPGNYLKLGEGYDFYVFDDKKGDLQLKVVGNPNIKNVSVNLTNSNFGEKFVDATLDGWNCVSNPFTACIDWDLASSTFGAYYSMDNTQEQKHISYVNGIASDNQASRYVAPMQGFFVHTDNIASKTFSKDWLVHKKTNFSKNSNAIKTDLIRLSANDNDQTVLYFEDDASYKFDLKYDAYKFFNDNVNEVEIYSIANDKALSINGLNSKNILYTTVDLGLKSFVDTTVTISVLQNTFLENDVYLVDNKEDSTINLSKNPNYTLRITEGDNQGRLTLKFLAKEIIDEELSKEETVLPIDLDNQVMGVENFVEKLDKVIVLPNPTKDFVKINFVENNQNLVEIFDNKGRKIFSDKTSERSMEVNLKNRASGIYFVRINMDKVYKIVKE